MPVCFGISCMEPAGEYYRRNPPPRPPPHANCAATEEEEQKLTEAAIGELLRLSSAVPENSSAQDAEEEAERKSSLVAR